MLEPMRARRSIRLPLLLAAALTALPVSAQPRDPLPVPNLPGFITLKCDFHMHTVFSDGEVWPTTRVAEAWRDGLDAIAMTDHAGTNPHSEDVSTDLRRPYAVAGAAAEKLRIILVPGVEIAERNTHCNALFVTDPNAFQGLGLIDALRKARAQDAFVFWNHPGWKETPRWIPLIAEAHGEGLLQGVELVNEQTYYPEVFPWIEEKQLTILANSDVHAPVSTDYPARTRPVTLLFARSADAAGVREALFAHRSAAWVNGEVWGSEQHLRGLWKGAVGHENPTITCRLSERPAPIQLANSSAIPFKLRVTRTPEWLYVNASEVRPQGVAAFPLGLARNAPAGAHSVELEFEVTNLHVGPGKNLLVKLPIEIEVTR